MGLNDSSKHAMYDEKLISQSFEICFLQDIVKFLKSFRMCINTSYVINSLESLTFLEIF